MGDSGARDLHDYIDERYIFDYALRALESWEE